MISAEAWVLRMTQKSDRTVRWPCRGGWGGGGAPGGVEELTAAGEAELVDV